jgi:hypothetical protein
LNWPKYFITGQLAINETRYKKIKTRMSCPEAGRKLFLIPGIIPPVSGKQLANIIMQSFIITLTYEGKPIIFRFVAEEAYAYSLYEVSALNSEQFQPFLMAKRKDEWKIITEVPVSMRVLEQKLGVMIDAYLEGR